MLRNVCCEIRNILFGLHFTVLFHNFGIMLILIAESKTMTACDESVSEKEYESHKPEFEEDAVRIMDSLRGSSPDKLVEELGISAAYSRKLSRMIYEFPNKSLGAEAIDAFTGVVFKALDYKSLEDSEKKRISRDLRIISSLYGLLRPDDIVKPYRFDFITHVAPGDNSLSAYWRPGVTESLLRLVKRRDCTDILDLLPADAARYIDWARIRGHAGIWKAYFRQIGENEVVRTPHAGKLKTLRGRFLRQIIQENISHPFGLDGLEGEDYVVSGVFPETGRIILDTVC